MEWHNALSVGIREFDADHKQVIELLEEIYDALAQKKLDHAIDLTNRLLSLATSHTEREEIFLRKVGFPGVDNVISAQKESLTRIRQLSEMFGQNSFTDLDSILDMQMSFIDYLLKADINYRSFVKSAGLSDC